MMSYDIIISIINHESMFFEKYTICAFYWYIICMEYFEDIEIK